MMQIGTLALTLAAVCAGNQRVELLDSDFKNHYDDVAQCMQDYDDYIYCQGQDEETGDYWVWNETDNGEHIEYFDEVFECGVDGDQEYCWGDDWWCKCTYDANENCMDDEECFDDDGTDAMKLRSEDWDYEF